jgi:hypothetical protein
VVINSFPTIDQHFIHKRPDFIHISLIEEPIILPDSSTTAQLRSWKMPV